MPLLAGALAAATLLACADDKDSVGDTEGAGLTGTVTDAQTRSKLRGARVSFTSDTLRSSETRTGDSGGYTLAIETDTPHGRLTVSRDGYVTEVVDVFFDTPSRRVDVRLEPED